MNINNRDTTSHLLTNEVAYMNWASYSFGYWNVSDILDNEGVEINMNYTVNGMLHTLSVSKNHINLLVPTKDDYQGDNKFRIIKHNDAFILKLCASNNYVKQVGEYFYAVMIIVVMDPRINIKLPNES